MGLFRPLALFSIFDIPLNYFPKKLDWPIEINDTAANRCQKIRTVGTFPNRELFLRLIVSYLIEDWPDDRSYIRPEKIATALENAHLSMEAH